MTSILYISPSIVPSRTANSIHVINQINALSEIGYSVTLICTTQSSGSVREKIEEFYGLRLNSNVTVDAFELKLAWAINLQIAVYALYKMLTRHRDKQAISRNLYFSFFSTLFWRCGVFETHGVETGVRAWMQKLAIMRHSQVVVISDALKRLLIDKFNCPASKFIVLPDAASNVTAINVQEHIAEPKNQKIGYFGHVYPGRGIEVVTTLAKKFPDVDFYVVGGEPNLVAEFRDRYREKNLVISGHLQNIVARSIMQEMDVLLMPYQKVVSIGLSGSDTSQWMSPLKMFEYMSSQVAIVSSDLPVIREVLVDKKNCLLVPPDDFDGWLGAVERLLNDSEYRAELANEAFLNFQTKYTWKHRAKAISIALKRL